MTEQTTQLAVVLPEEVQAIALKVSDEKRAEVNNVLTQVFSGTAEWKAQVEAISVKDPSDKLGMNLAKTARLNAKNARLAAEKIFDQKRDEVQYQMLSYQTEDKLWLKAKQSMQILFKEIESMAEYKEKTAERFEIEQHELKIQARLTRLASVNPDITRQEIELMSDASFDAFLGGLIKAKEDAEKAEKAEQERLRQVALRKERDDNRFKILAGTGLIFTGGVFAKNENISYDFSKLCELDDDAFIVKVQEATDKIAECRALEIKEKERLATIAKAKEKELEEERKKAEEERKQAEIKKKAIEEAAKIEREKQQAELKRQQEQAAAEKKRQDEIIAKQNAEIEAKYKQELAAKAEAERLAKAPKKEKLTAWIDALVITCPTGEESDLLVQNILSKFDGFKKWAKSEIEKL